jgi:hypothetical protein
MQGGNAEDALTWAIKCLREGSWDGYSQDGAKTNAMESIAWSLVGLLAIQLEKRGAATSTGAAKPPDAAQAADGGAAELTLKELAQRAGLMPVERP